MMKDNSSCNDLSYLRGLVRSGVSADSYENEDTPKDIRGVSRESPDVTTKRTCYD